MNSDRLPASYFENRETKQSTLFGLTYIGVGYVPCIIIKL